MTFAGIDSFIQEKRHSGPRHNSAVVLGKMNVVGDVYVDYNVDGEGKRHIALTYFPCFLVCAVALVL